MPKLDDPYLNAVRLSLNEKKIRGRQKKLKAKKKKKHSKGFLTRNIELSHYLNLPESVQNILLFSLFIAIPYLLGILFIFLVMAEASFEKYSSLCINSFPLIWSLGYECLAFLILLIILKSALCFKKC